MSTDYTYDEQVRTIYIYNSENSSLMSLRQGQFFPFFILTLSGLVTLPLTYNLLKPSKRSSALYSQMTLGRLLTD